MERTYNFYKSMAQIRQTASDDMSGSWWYCAKITMFELFLALIIAGGVTWACIAYPIWYVMAPSIFVGCFLVYVLIYGYQAFFLNFTSKLSSKFSDLFSGFKKIFKLLKIFITKIFIMIFGLALLVFPFFMFGLSYTMSSFALVDDKTIPAKDALKQSKRLMNENKKRLAKLRFENLGWILLCFTFIGAFWALPFLFTNKAVFYEDLKTAF